LDGLPNVMTGGRNVRECAGCAGWRGGAQCRPIRGIERCQRQRQRQDQENMKLRLAWSKVHCSSSCQPAILCCGYMRETLQVAGWILAILFHMPQTWREDGRRRKGKQQRLSLFPRLT